MNIQDLLSDEVVQIGNKEVSLLDLFNIEEDTVSIDMMKQAALYAHIGMLKVRYERKRNDLKQKRDEIYADLDLAYREHYTANSLKITEKAIESEIRVAKDYIDILQRLSIAEEQYAIFEVLTRTMEMRANMLQSIGAFLRMEQSMTGMQTKDYERSIAEMRNKIRK